MSISWLKKFGLVAMCFALVLGMSSGALAAKDTLVVANMYDAKSLDPHVTPDVGSAHIMVQIYETLLKTDDKGEIVPSLAESYEKIDDRTYRFHLREGVKFHNGEELKASDVAFTFHRAIEIGKTIGFIVGNIDPASIKVEDDYTIVMGTKTPDTSFLACLTHFGGGCILNEKAVNEAGDDYGTHPVGTGPYKFVDWQKGDRITLTRFDEYWGTKPAIKDVVVRAITEQTNRTIELESGGVDIAYAIPPLDIRRIEENSKLKLIRVPDVSVQYMGFNCSKKPFSDVRVRQAITMALDLEKLNKAVYRGIGGPAYGPIPPRLRYFNTNLSILKYDPERAKELLAEAGYPEGFKASIWTNDRKERIDIATIAQSMLAKVGITVDIQVMEWGAYLDKLSEKQHDMYLMGWSTPIPDPDYAVYGIFHSSQIKGMNKSVYSNPKADELMDRGRTLPDGDERRAIYEELQTLLVQEAPWVFVHNGEEVVGTSKNVKGFVADPAGYHKLYTVSFEE
ncbi:MULTISPECIES: ABC transporter substrate-binding protein [Aminobacterium]|jgi:peptide/nickel transport system substrate-binding protein|uniref:ABC transporter substrate-binding protein n=1 Tax=Aminobacterium TaxID=81466 RepID=UPI000467C859|nr:MULTISPECIES: ABC transporter substrate-binding protein [Aminobacterium]